MGVHPVLINWIANFLTDRKQRTRIENHYSSWKTINPGVPQGTKLGPLLFLIMVNDLSVSPDTVKFVDDTTIWEIIRKSQTFSSVLPAQINECTNWVLQNNMKLNPQRTSLIIHVLFRSSIGVVCWCPQVGHRESTTTDLVAHHEPRVRQVGSVSVLLCYGFAISLRIR